MLRTLISLIWSIILAIVNVAVIIGALIMSFIVWLYYRIVGEPKRESKEEVIKGSIDKLKGG